MAGIRRRTAGAADKALRAKAPTGSANFLPLIHVTSVGVSKEIILSGQLETRACARLGRSLLYFFVARPAYHLRDSSGVATRLSQFPAAFVVSPTNLSKPVHVYPFDTGGALAGHFADKADPHVLLEDYQLDSTWEAICGHIKWAFGGVKQYLNGELRPELLNELDPFEFAPRSFVEIALLASSGHNAPDQRASAIEVAYSQHVPLKAFAELIVVPKQFLEGRSQNKQMIDALQGIGVEVIGYDWSASSEPSEYYRDIRDATEAHLFKFYKASA